MTYQWYYADAFLFMIPIVKCWFAC